MSTDFLLKEDACMDDMGNGCPREEAPPEWQEQTEKQKDRGWRERSGEEREVSPRFVDRVEAETFMEVTKQVSRWLALGVFLCICSPICVIILGGLSDYGSLSEDMAGGVGVTVLLAMVAAAVALFILHGMKLTKYQYLDKEPILLEDGLRELVEEKKEAYGSTFRMGIVLGVTLCIGSVIPIMLAVAFNGNRREMILVCCVGILLALVACGVYLFIRVGMVQDSYRKLLQEEEYSRENKQTGKKLSPFCGAYWCIVTAIYLAVSFSRNNWENSWVIWPVAGVLFAAVYNILKAVVKPGK